MRLSILGDRGHLAMKDPYDVPVFFFSTGSDRIEAEISHEG